MAMASKVNVAVIGGSGMLGKHLVNGFLNNGKYKVTVITRPVSAQTVQGTAIGVMRADTQQRRISCSTLPRGRLRCWCS